MVQIFNNEHLDRLDARQYETIVILRGNSEISRLRLFISWMGKWNLTKEMQAISLATHRDPTQDYLILKNRLLVTVLASP